jgi:L-asparaginase II
MNKYTDGTVPLACVTRAGLKDNLHRGAAVAVDSRGKMLKAFGGSHERAFMRSSAKPIQCLPVITSGAAADYGFSDRDIAIICGSHLGGASQAAQVRSILKKSGVDENKLLSGEGISDNCSGKHAGMLAACRHSGYSLKDYTSPEHPHQKRILEALKEVCCLKDREIRVGIDGCSAPIHNFPLYNMALGYARMSVPEKHFDRDTASALRRIARAMWENSGGHTGEPEYRRALRGGIRLITKAGGNGVYCAGVPDAGIGLAIKIEDGSFVPCIPLFIEIMRRLGALSAKEAKGLDARFSPKVENRRGQTVGGIDLLI